MIVKEKNRCPVCFKGQSERISEMEWQTHRGLHSLETQGKTCLI